MSFVCKARANRIFANTTGNFVSRLFARTTIKSQIWVGFGLFLAILQAVEAHSTDRYRTDVFLVKTEIGPLMAKIESDLGPPVDQLKQQIADTSAGLQRSRRYRRGSTKPAQASTTHPTRARRSAKSLPRWRQFRI